ncbi:MAG: ATP-binding cassette domain-containing protein [Actinobacteria bacterium]|nr:MAG: ATP-binding cassette domain-containing protein [Actinomycetota bacterium]
MAGNASPDAAIELVDVVKDFDSVRVLDGVNLVVPRGAITVLLGASGAGKTVTVNHIVGLIHPNQGAVYVNGRQLARLSDAEMTELRLDMAAVLQGSLPFTCGLFFSMNVYENVASPLRQRRPRWSEERIEQVTMESLRLVGLAESAEIMPDELSSGMAKRTAIARALALEASIVIIDDFDSGIDGVRLALLCDLLRELQRDSDATLLVTTHDMSAARRLADYVAVIHEGRIIASGEAESVFESTEDVVAQLIAGELTGPIQLRSS